MDLNPIYDFNSLFTLLSNYVINASLRQSRVLVSDLWITELQTIKPLVLTAKLYRRAFWNVTLIDCSLSSMLLLV